MRVVFDLLPGWIELPRAGERPKGLPRRDPVEVLARQMVQAGRVAPHLVDAAAGAMRLFAPGETNTLGVALSMSARTGPDLQSARLHVVGPVETPRLAGGDPDWDAIGTGLRQDVRPDPASPTDRVELSWGQGLRVSVADPDAGRHSGVSHVATSPGSSVVHGADSVAGFFGL